MGHDLRLAIRRLRRAPGFTALAVGMLALGIGATTTAFSLINTVFLRPPAHVRDPGRVVAVYTSDYSGPAYGNTSYPDLEDFRAGAGDALDLAAYTLRPLSVAIGTESFRTAGEFVTGNYFPLLGVAPALGRFPAGGDDVSGVVISHGLWQRRFGGAADAVGSPVTVAGRSFTVVGVAPAGFSGSIRGVGTELWLAVEAARLLEPGRDPLAERGHRDLFVVGRLRPGVTAQEAEARLAVVARRLHAAYPDRWTDLAGAGRRISVLPERDARIFPSIRGPVRGFLGVLLGIAGLVLVVCCANLANLLLARGTARRREMAVRLALGAARARLVRQLLVEGLVLALLGGTGGVLLAAWATALLGRLQPPVPVPVALDLGVDARVLGFSLLATVLVTIVSALAPALRATRVERGAEGLRVEAGVVERGGRHVSLRDGLVVLQVAVSLVVLVAAGLFLGSLREATRIDPGFTTSGLALLPVELSAQGYDEQRGRRFHEALVARARALPGVEAASLAQVVPLGLTRLRRGLEVEGYTPAAGEEMEFGVSAVGDDYFSTMGIPLIRGRPFEARDREGSPRVAIVNQSFARRFWPGGEAIGRRLVVGDSAWTIVGVARDAKYVSLGEAPQPYWYLPWAQAYEPDMVLHVRTAGDPRPVLPALAAVAKALDPALPVQPITIGEHLGLALLPQRLGALVLGAFGTIGTLLAALGLYGVVSYTVSLRTTEIGIRMALGADAGAVRRLVVRRGLALTAVGLLLGLAGAAAAGPLVRGLLFGVTPLDPLVLTAAAGLFGAVALVASWVPARRAARLDPVRALRAE